MTISNLIFNIQVSCQLKTLTPQIFSRGFSEASKTLKLLNSMILNSPFFHFKATVSHRYDKITNERLPRQSYCPL